MGRPHCSNRECRYQNARTIEWVRVRNNAAAKLNGILNRMVRRALYHSSIAIQAFSFSLQIPKRINWNSWGVGRFVMLMLGWRYIHSIYLRKREQHIETSILWWMAHSKMLNYYVDNMTEYLSLESLSTSHLHATDDSIYGGTARVCTQHYYHHRHHLSSLSIHIFPCWQTGCVRTSAWLPLPIRTSYMVL